MTISQNLEAKAWAHDLVSGKERQSVHACSCPRARARAEAVPTLLWREAATSCQRAESCSGLVEGHIANLGPLWRHYWLHQNSMVMCGLRHTLMCGATKPGPPRDFVIYSVSCY